MNGKLVSMGTILWRVLRQPIAEGLTYEQASEFALEFIRLINAPLTFIDVITNPPLELSMYKVELPPNLINIRGVQYMGENGDSSAVNMRYATDIYHLDLSKTPEENSTEYTYLTQGCVLTASKKDGFINISYKAIAVDDDGYPMVPDNESFKMGLEYYILHRFLEPLWMMGKIQDKVFSYIEQKRHWYLGQASSSSIIQSADHLESIMNGLNRLIINTKAFDNGYKNFGEKERIRRY